MCTSPLRDSIGILGALTVALLLALLPTSGRCEDDQPPQSGTFKTPRGHFKYEKLNGGWVLFEFVDATGEKVVYQSPANGPVEVAPSAPPSPPMPYTYSCGFCSGQGRRQCDLCFGSGHNDDAMRAAQRFLPLSPTPEQRRSANQPINCVRCSGTGMIPCTYCGSTGKMMILPGGVHQPYQPYVAAAYSQASVSAAYPRRPGAGVRTTNEKSDVPAAPNGNRGRVAVLLARRDVDPPAALNDPKKPAAEIGVSVSNVVKILSSSSGDIRFFAMLRNTTNNPIQADILRLSWLKGDKDDQIYEIGGPSDTILPGEEAFFTFKVQRNAQAKWDLTTPFRITVTRTTSPEIDKNQEEELRKNASQLKEIRILNTECAKVQISDGIFAFHEVWTPFVTIYNANKQDCNDVIIQSLGYNKAGSLVEVRVVHLDWVHPRVTKTNLGNHYTSDLVYEHHNPNLCIFEGSPSQVDKYEARVVAVGKKKEEVGN